MGHQRGAAHTHPTEERGSAQKTGMWNEEERRIEMKAHERVAECTHPLYVDECVFLIQ